MYQHLEHQIGFFRFFMKYILIEHYLNAYMLIYFQNIRSKLEKFDLGQNQSEL